MDLKFNKFKTISDFNNVIINKGDVTFIEESKSILVDGVDYTGNKGTVQTINLFNYQDEETPIVVNGPFDVYIEINDPDSPEVYYSSHRRYLAYSNSVARFDCFFHSMETDKLGKGLIYSMLLKQEDGTWSHQGYVDVGNESIVNPDFSLKEYTDDTAAKADFESVLNVIRVAFSEENSSAVFINLADHTDGREFSVNGPFLCYYDDGRKKFQSYKHIITTSTAGMIYRAECFNASLNDDFTTTGALYAILNFDENKNTWRIYGWYNIATGKGYEADFSTEVGQTYFEGDSDVILSMFKDREIQALTVKGDGNKFLANDGNYYEISSSEPIIQTSLPSDGVLVPNTIYELGTINSLNIGSIPVSHKEIVIYYSTSSNFTMNLPNCDVVGDLEAASDKKYVISILNGIVIQGEISN